jgi:hypothetical protein
MNHPFDSNILDIVKSFQQKRKKEKKKKNLLLHLRANMNQAFVSPLPYIYINWNKEGHSFLYVSQTYHRMEDAVR